MKDHQEVTQLCYQGHQLRLTMQHTINPTWHPIHDQLPCILTTYHLAQQPLQKIVNTFLRKEKVLNFNTPTTPKELNGIKTLFNELCKRNNFHYPKYQTDNQSPLSIGKI